MLIKLEEWLYLASHLVGVINILSFVRKKYLNVILKLIFERIQVVYKSFILVVGNIMKFQSVLKSKGKRSKRSQESLANKICKI